MTHIPQKIAIIGNGQLGCSLGSALKGADATALHITGFDAQAKASAKALALGALDATAETMQAAVADADIIILCSPLNSMRACFSTIAKHAKPDAIITDVGSAKAPLMEMAHELIPNHHFIGGHPIAGREKSGADAGDPTLFEDRKMWLTRCPQRDGCEKYEASVAKVEALWKHTGACVERIDAAQHDQIYGMTSHLAQLLAWSYAKSCEGKERQFIMHGAEAEHHPYYRFIRIGGSSSHMWEPIFQYNKDNLLSSIDLFLNALDALMQAVSEPTPASANTYLKATSDWRQNTRLIYDQSEEWVHDPALPSFMNLLPVVVASAYVKATQKLSDLSEVNGDIQRHLGAGFYGVTRPAACPVETTIPLLANSEEWKAEVAVFRTTVVEFRAAIETGDMTALDALVKSCKTEHTASIGKVFGVQG